ncbi:Uncharacterised protein [Mycobacteroides abscessus subsp. abscessus]|nr:Uncharacterised protein [Mycobacteroides abscessus subsp. abscessus]
MSSPSRGDSPGSTPSSRIRCSSFWVPSAAPAKTTCSAVKVLGSLRIQRPDRSVSTAYPPPGSGRTAVAVVSSCTRAPACSAR